MESNGQHEFAELFPSGAPQGQLVSIPVDDFPARILGPAPDRALVASVKTLGVLVPIMAIYDEGWVILDGRRRVMAARLAGLTDVPVMQFRPQDVNASILTLTANKQRAENPIAEYDAIMQLVRDGYGQDEIARATGMTIAEVRKRLKFTDLHEELLELARGGAITPGVAEAASRLARPAQDRLLLGYWERGGKRLSMSDVREERTAARQQATNIVAMQMPELTQPDVTDLALTHVQAAIALLEDDAHYTEAVAALYAISEQLATIVT